MDEEGEEGFGWRQSGGKATCEPIQPAEDYAAEPWAPESGRGDETGLVKIPCSCRAPAVPGSTKKGRKQPSCELALS